MTNSKSFKLKSRFLTLFRMGFTGAAHRPKKSPLPAICNTCPAMINLGTAIIYLSKIQKTNKSCDTPLEL